MLFPLKLEDIAEQTQNFCPKCKSEFYHSHLVQCSNCQTILNFIPANHNEDAVIFYVDKCSQCSCTNTDFESKIEQFPDELWV